MNAEQEYVEYCRQFREYWTNLSCAIAVFGGYLWYTTKDGRRRKMKRRYGVHPINQLRDTHGAYTHLYQELRDDPERFFKSFRMNIPQFDNLLDLVSPYLKTRDTSRHNPMPNNLRLVVTIAFLAHGDSIHTLAALFRIGITTCREIIKEVCEAICSGLIPIYVRPPTLEDFNYIAKEFQGRWNLPHCLGACDGKHVALKAPPNAGSDFFNYKKHHSINLFAFCDASYCFTIAEVGYMGSMGDGGIFRASPFANAITNNELHVPAPAILPGSKDKTPFPYFFVGDEAFALRNNFMIPYGKASLNVADANLKLERRIFNYRLSRARRVIENCFGILANRWRILHRKIEAMPETAVQYVQASVCLHNYLMKTKVGGKNVAGYYGDVYGSNDELVSQGTWRTDQNPFTDTPVRCNRNPTTTARLQRDAIAKYLSNENVLDYQVNYVNGGSNAVNEAIAVVMSKK